MNRLALSRKLLSISNRYLNIIRYSSKKKRKRRQEFMDMINKFRLPSIYAHIAERDVGYEYDLAAEMYNPINLAQNIPDFIPDDRLLLALKRVAQSPDHHIHQACRRAGHERLVNALAKLYSEVVYRHIDPMTEICVTCGQYQAIYLISRAHVHPRNEVVIIDPSLESFGTLVTQIRGKPKFIALKPKEGFIGCSSADWALDEDMLEKLFSAKTKMVIISSPNSQLGKVYTQEELEFIAYLCNKWNVLCVSDECYEYGAYHPNQHIRMASLPGMWDRTLTISSVGQIFGLSGWRIGWIYGPNELMENVRIVQSNILRSVVTPMQVAMAMIIENEINAFGTSESYISTMLEQMEKHRLFMANTLIENDMFPVLPQAGCYMFVDWSNYRKFLDESAIFDDRPIDYHFTYWLLQHRKILVLPASAYVDEDDKDFFSRYIRISFGKKMKTLKKFAKAMEEWKHENQNE